MRCCLYVMSREQIFRGIAARDQNDVELLQALQRLYTLDRAGQLLNVQEIRDILAKKTCASMGCKSLLDL